MYQSTSSAIGTAARAPKRARPSDTGNELGSRVESPSLLPLTMITERPVITRVATPQAPGAYGIPGVAGCSRSV